MTRYDIRSYDFKSDELFEKFFQEKLSDKRIPRPQFIYKLNQSKVEWIRILNSPRLRFKHGIPKDFGE